MTDIQLPPLPPKALLRTLHSDRLPTSPFTVYAHTDETLEAYARAAIEAHEARKVPDGWQLVPKEPTPEMLQIGKHAAPYRAVDVYRAMLASAPPAPQASKCPTCNDNGLIGGPSFYAPDEGGAHFYRASTVRQLLTAERERCRKVLTLAKAALAQSNPCAAPDCKAEQQEWKDAAMQEIDAFLQA